MFRQIAYFLCFIDEEPRISLSNIAFIVILGKIIFAAQVDWTALVTLSLACLNLAHERQTTAAITPDITNLTNQLINIEQKLSPIIDKLKGA